MKQKFNPNDWLRRDARQSVSISEQPKPLQFQPSPKSSENQNTMTDVEEIITRIESKSLDIATAYSDWRDIGFAFASEFGEQGRNYFHRISRFYSDYSATECDKQYNKCLKSKNSGITIKTFFQKAKEAGVNIAVNTNTTIDSNPDDDFIETPCIPEKVFQNLPSLLNDVCIVFSSQREKDMMLLGSIVTLSSCIENVYGIYLNDKVFANLYLFVTAQASAGKGALKHCKRLVMPIHNQLREASKLAKAEYKLAHSQYLHQVKKDPSVEKPVEPKDLMLFLPANNSSTGVFQLLDDCGGKGIIFETEGDTLAQIFKTDYGNYSDGFRKAYHHESISYYRRTGREFVEIDNPRLSTVLTGTPRQITNLIPDAEDGLFSRFMYYRFPITNVWNDVFQKKTTNGFDDYFNQLGNRFYALYLTLKKEGEKEFCFTEAQQKNFNRCFEKWQTEFIELLGNESVANVRRMGLICFRIAMILTVLRILDTGDISKTLLCSDNDFNTAMEIGRVLLDHAKTVYLHLMTMPRKIKQETMKDKLYNQLPDEFTRKEAIECAEKLGIKTRTADKYLAEMIPLLLSKDTVYGKYKKQNVQSVQSM